MMYKGVIYLLKLFLIVIMSGNVFCDEKYLSIGENWINFRANETSSWLIEVVVNDKYSSIAYVLFEVENE
jgi:hypothetical protein